MTLQSAITRLMKYLIDTVPNFTMEMADKSLEVYSEFERCKRDGKAAYVSLYGVVTDVRMILMFHGDDVKGSLRDVLSHPSYGIDREKSFPVLHQILYPYFFENKTLEEIQGKQSPFLQSLIYRDHTELESFGKRPEESAR